MKILSVEQIREADSYTIKHEPVPSIALMERAAAACTEAITALAAKGFFYYILAGQGNNGGDGLVIARLLSECGKNVHVAIPQIRESGSADFEINLKRLAGTPVKVTRFTQMSDMPIPESNSIVIDALFGSGLTRPVTGLLAEVIDLINRSGLKVISIDIPSGLFSDKHTDAAKGAVIRAGYTLTLELPKLALLMPDNYQYTGYWSVVPIGLHQDYLRGAETDHSLFTLDDAVNLFTPRSRIAHKGSYGHGLLIAGSRDKAGAAMLAASGALRSGAGLLTAFLPLGLSTVCNVALPEVMVVSDPESEYLTMLPDLKRFTAIAAGPGIGVQKPTIKVIRKLLENASVPLVLDADALNILAMDPDLLKLLPPGTVLTPHPKEFERVAGKADNCFHRLELAKDFAKNYDCTIVLKSSYTAVVMSDGKCSFNATGNAGLAKGGSGDTLTGMILGLICRGYSPVDAAGIAVFAHGKAAEICAEKTGLDAIIASDISATLGAVWKLIEDHKMILDSTSNT